MGRRIGEVAMTGASYAERLYLASPEGRRAAERAAKEQLKSECAEKLTAQRAKKLAAARAAAEQLKSERAAERAAAKQLETDRKAEALARLRQEVAGQAEREAAREEARLVRKRELRKELAVGRRGAARLPE
jgi:hypothetical protein